ncbi:MAG: hypothetical protein ACRCST_05360 [Turicibacter sp.]
MTKFANPLNQQDPLKSDIVKDIRSAVINQNINKLCILIGVKHQGSTDQAMMSYNIKSFNNEKTAQELISEGFRINTATYSVDVDTSRVFTITPVLLLQRNISFLNEHSRETIIYVDQQIEIPADGTGAIGEKNQLYVDLLVKAIMKHNSSYSRRY